MITLLNVLSIASKDVPVPTMDSIDISKSTFNEIERRLENNRNEILAIYNGNLCTEQLLWFGEVISSKFGIDYDFRQPTYNEFYVTCLPYDTRMVPFGSLQDIVNISDELALLTKHLGTRIEKIIKYVDTAYTMFLGDDDGLNQYLLNAVSNLHGLDDENDVLDEDDVVLRETPKSRKKTNPKKANNPEKVLN